MPLRRFDVRVSEHQLNDADVHATGQQPAGNLVPQIVPVQINVLLADEAIVRITQVSPLRLPLGEVRLQRASPWR